MMKKLLTICFLMVTASVHAQVTYPTLTTFGKNRIQYKRFDWQVLTTPNFEVYFYQDGQAEATLTAQMAEAEFDRVTDVLGYTPYSRTKIFVYQSVQDLNMSNVGATLGSIKDVKDQNLAKSRIEIPFNDSQVAFRKMLSREIANVYVHDMLFGGNLKDALQSSLLLSVPDWYLNGITTYISEGWSTEMDDYVRDLILTKRVQRPNYLINEDATRVGQSIWNYIADKYGKESISNILNLTRIIRNEETSIGSTVGMPYSRFLREWRDYYGGLADQTATNYKKPAFDAKLIEASLSKDYRLNQAKISPDNQWVAISGNTLGKTTVELVNVRSKKSYIVFSRGYKTLVQTTNNNTPLVSWARDGRLAIVYEHLGKIWVDVYNQITDKNPSGKLLLSKRIGDIGQVSDFDISDTGLTLVLSAESKGQNDLYLFELNRGTLTQLTNDWYDDLNPQFIGRTSQIIFVSNRVKDTLDVDKGNLKSLGSPFKIFLHEGKPREKVLTRLADSLGRVSQPIALEASTLYFLSDTRGINNLYKMTIDSNSHELRQLTDFRTNIVSYDLNPASGAFVYKTAEAGTEYIGYQAHSNLEGRVPTPLTPRVLKMNGLYTDQTGKTATSVENKPVEEKVEGSLKDLQAGEVDTDNYQFEANATGKAQEKKQERKQTKQSERATAIRAKNRDNVKIKGPTDYLNPFVTNGSELAPVVDPVRGFGVKYSITLNDLLENHRVKVGVFVPPANLRSSDIYAEYTYLPKRIDYSARFDRKTFAYENLETNVISKKNVFNQLTLTASYPFTPEARLTLGGHYTLSRFLNLEPGSIALPDKVSDYAGIKAEFVYDNTVVTGENQQEGTRLKVKYEQYEGLTQKSDGFKRFSVDVRHYQKITKDLVLATRLSVNRSFGDSPKMSIVGGVDNWLSSNCLETRNPSDPTLNPFDFENNLDNRDLFFLDFATPMRGFRFNKLAGTSHLLFNAELRYPLAKLFTQGPIYNNFLKNFMVTVFTDVGTAWTGDVGPFARVNSFNTEIVGGVTKEGTSPFRATVTNFKSPFLVGYGLGIRTTVLGFYTKLDYAWGVENKSVNKPIVYLSLGHDF